MQPLGFSLGIQRGGLPAVAGAPKPPSGLSASAISSTQINLTWTDGSDDETSFTLETSPNGSSGWTVVSSVIAANSVSYSHTSLTPLTLYYYRIKAVNGSGSSSYSNVANATTLSSRTQENTPWYDDVLAEGTAPWQVDFYDADSFLGCSGVILSENYILTSAFAFETLFNATIPKIRAGGIDPANPSETFEQTGAPDFGFYHENWTGLQDDGYDIALIWFDAGWTFGTYVNSIPYSGTDEGNYPVDTIMGAYGILKWDAGAVAGAEVLTGEHVTRISEETADTAYGGGFNVDSSQIPVIGSTKIWLDYGSGLIAYDGAAYYLAGLMSYPPQLAVQEISVFTNIASHATWIDNNTGIAPFF